MGGRRVRVSKGLSSRAEVRERVRGECGFSSLVKQNKKAEICFVIYIAGFFFLKFFCYEVIVKQKIYKRSSNYYWGGEWRTYATRDYEPRPV
jgi:hypothetical protein